MPSVAAITVAVVQAMPLVVNVRLYGACGPVRRAVSVGPDALGELAAA